MVAGKADLIVQPSSLANENISLLTCGDIMIGQQLVNISSIQNAVPANGPDGMCMCVCAACMCARVSECLCVYECVYECACACLHGCPCGSSCVRAGVYVCSRAVLSVCEACKDTQQML